MKETPPKRFRLRGPAGWKSLAAGCILLNLFVVNQLSGQTPPSGQRLRQLQGANFLIGSETDDNFWTLSDTTMYQTTIGREFSIITPGNQLKWDTTEPQQNVFNFAPGDMHLSFANANGMQLHGHNLAWHNQNPGWLTGGNFNAAQLTQILQNHIDNVVGHYKGKIPMWDVVNEAFNDDGTRRSTLWQNGIGNSYIDIAFTEAHKTDPAAELIYNDFNIETVNAKSTAVLQMMEDMKSRGIPINTVGIQGHLLLSGIDFNSLSQNMARFAAAGFNIRFTELDVRMNVPPGANDFQTQATVYQNIVHACLMQPACKSIQLWGFTDKYSWVPGTFSGQGDALIFDTNYAPKPAYFAIQTEMAADIGGGGGGDTQPPTTPTGLMATGTTSSTISLAWNASTDNVGVTQYVVLQGGTQVGTTATTSFTVTGLPAGTSFTFSVVAKDAAGNASAPSASVTAQTSSSGGGDTQPPTTPTGLMATGATSSTISLAWNASTDNVGVTQYVVLQGGTQVGTTATTSFTVSGLQAGTSFTFSVVAKDAAGNASAPSASVTAQTSSAGGGGGGGSCHVTYTMVNQWGNGNAPTSGGFQSDMRITNTGSAVTSWTLNFSFPGSQMVTQLWNGVVSQSGSAVTVTNASYNANIPTGATVDVGFLGNWNGTNPSPTSFTLNGTACAVN